uniref:Uncharacterized protein n=1 Tax=Arundo donax TaxID=35708 RepID=A0A0A9FU30_ARUDO
MHYQQQFHYQLFYICRYICMWVLHCFFNFPLQMKHLLC